MRRILALLTCVTVTVSAIAQIPPKEIAAPDTWVDDEFIAYVHGLVYGDHELDTDGESFRRRFPEFNTDRWSPFDEITWIARKRTADGPRIILEFEAPMEHTVAAVSIMGWRPVTLRGSARIIGAEIHAAGREGAELRSLLVDRGIDELVVFQLVDSRMEVDIADFLDFLLGPLVDDIEVRLAAVARMNSTWYGLMGGVNRHDVPKTGIYNLTTNEFVLRPPRELTELAVALIERTGAAGGD